MPTVSWPQCGEIDVVEVVGQTPHTVYGTLHGPRADGSAWSHGRQTDTGLDLSAAFHTYSVTWTTGTISFEFDGVSYGSVDRSVLAANETWSFDTTGFFLLLNLAVGGDWPGPPAASTTFPQTMTIDYVRVYQ
jgi:beta-glucanase (GH16 family)